MPPIVTFLSDFGLADPYVAAVKGVLLSRCSGLTIVDVTHTVAPQDIFAGAMLLREACCTFPAGTLHLAVVDPGVGTERAALVARTDRFTFVGPDNGLLAPALDAETGVQVFRIKPNWEVPSATFHARDVFAPAAGRLLAGESGSDFLEAAGGYQHLDVPAPRELPPREGEASRWEGVVLRIDGFGNLITNLPRQDFGPFFERHAFELSAPGGETLTRLAPTYQDAPHGAAVAVWGSAGFLELSVREYSAAGLLGIHEAGERFEIAFLR
ncbi:MAG: SAM-dependent chlorinase/fluorinase [Candidatus Riflebacteria bacterium]|nr:SAM-dependent chlorinase/fluorinase [Candidatus Riflebacteria bacterium]